MNGMTVQKPRKTLPPRVMGELQQGLDRCPDVAFAHLPEVKVEGQQAAPNLVLFVWLRAEALRSVRSALNLVSEVVAGALPEDEFVDVVILNSAPELLEAIEAAGCLLAEPDPGERQRALEAARSGQQQARSPATGKSWWPF